MIPRSELRQRSTWHGPPAVLGLLVVALAFGIGICPATADDSPVDSTLQIAWTFDTGG